MKKPVKYGINQTIHTNTLKWWKLEIAFSFLTTNTLVAQIAWINISKMADIPVIAWILGLSLPDISNIIPVPIVSQAKPLQKKIRCQYFNLRASLSLQTPIEYKINARVIKMVEIRSWVVIILILVFQSTLSVMKTRSSQHSRTKECSIKIIVALLVNNL